jgi:tRNA A-37 threonylcarbamoyl transferase component Bud32
VREITVRKDGLPRTVFLKKYWSASLASCFKAFGRGAVLGRSKVCREYENLRRLRQWGLDAPEPIGYGEERRCRFLKRSFLLSEGVPQPRPLDSLIRDHLPRLQPAQRANARRELIDRLADYTRRLHQRGFVHHDLFWRNIILSGGGLDHFYLIDAHKGRRWWPWADTASRAKDLAALDAPAPAYFRRTERLRFFLRYRGRARLTQKDKRLIARTLKIAAPLRLRQSQRVAQASIAPAPAAICSASS